MYFLVAFLLMVTVIVLSVVPGNRDRKLSVYAIKLFCRLFFVLNFKQKNFFDLNGLTAPEKGERRIYVVNHTSIFDSIMIYSLPGPITSVMKESYMAIPFTGLISFFGGNVILKKRERGFGTAIYDRVIAKMERGVPLMMYPEGTRSKDTKIGRFHSGVFKIARETGATVYPVIFDNGNVIPPGRFRIGDLNIHIKILDPILPDEHNGWTIREFSSIVKRRMIEGLFLLRDHRMQTEPGYYRHHPYFQALDQEMKEEITDDKTRE